MSNALQSKRDRAARRANRTRAQIKGSTQRPRLSVFRSLKHITAQVIDDATGKTLVFAKDTEIKTKGTKAEKATAVGALVAKKAVEKKITQVVFDRGAYQYHGRVKALAEAAREGGLQF